MIDYSASLYLDTINISILYSFEEILRAPTLSSIPFEVEATLYIIARILL